MRGQKVLVAMSGGVDSSLTAALLVERGFEVEGVTMLLEDGNFHERSCCSSKEAEDAAQVSEKLGIKFHVVDFREEFRKAVVNSFVAEYLNGRTPNPCVRCNRAIKFGKLFDLATKHGMDFLATGHYARIAFEGGRFRLKRGVDERKDQSYVLYNLTAEKLSRIRFPLGEFSKADVRRLAAEKKLPVAKKPDSQEICFVPDDDYKSFLKDFAPDADSLKEGEIINECGEVLGKHGGIANYTIGQRKGLGIAAPHPLYVTRLDVEKRRVIVGKGEELFSTQLKAWDVHWIYKPPLPIVLQAKIRYGSRFSECTVVEEGNELRVTFAEPQRAITPGQSIVFYDGDEVLGGAIIGG